MSDSTSELSFQTNMNEKEIIEWFEKGEWLDGLKMRPSLSVNKLNFAEQYRKNQSCWDKAFAFLKNTDLINLEPGEYEIDGKDVFAIVAHENKKDFSATKWESHKLYNDIQSVIAGKEKMGVAPVLNLTVTEDYDEKRDVGFYQGDGDYYTAEPGTFFIFFPQDGHRPDIKLDDCEKDKKIVIKVRNF